MIDGSSTKCLILTCSSEKALEVEGALKSAITLEKRPKRHGVPQRHLRGDAQLRQILRMRCSSCNISGQRWVTQLLRVHLPGACVIDSKGLHDKMQHTVITPKRKGTSCGHRVSGLEKRVESFLSQVFVGAQWSATWKWYYQRHRDGDH